MLAHLCSTETGTWLSVLSGLGVIGVVTNMLIVVIECKTIDTWSLGDWSTKLAVFVISEVCSRARLLVLGELLTCLFAAYSTCCC